jgi:glycerol-3-phosphate cytidylyltransferase
MCRVLTFVIYDLLHWCHIRTLKRAREQGDYIIVGLFTEQFNKMKGKISYYNYAERKKMLEAIRHVDLVIAENDWEQKSTILFNTKSMS